MANDEEQVNDQVNYENVFNAEIEGWCYGLYHYPGEITAPLVHALIREIRATFVRAVENNVVFNVTEISELFCQAAKYLIPEKEIAFSILVPVSYTHLRAHET